MSSIQLLDTVSSVKLSQLRAAPVPIEWHSGVPIYASKEFLRSESPEFGWVGGIDAQGRAQCVLPFVIVRKAGVRMVRFRTGTIHLGPELELEEERRFLSSTLAYFRSIGADVIIPSGNHAIFRAWPDTAAAAPYGTFINDLTLSEDVLFGAIRKSFRQNIRKAISSGVQIKSGMEYLAVIYELIAETLRRSGESFKSYKEFKAKVESFGQFVKLFVAEHDGVIQGCMVAPFSEHTAYNCYAGSKVQPVIGAMHLLHWEAMKQFRNIGVKRFDFQGVRVNPEKGSKQEGIMHYKQGFGGKFVQGFLWKCPLHSLKSAVYNVGIKLLSGGDIVDREQSKLVPA